MNWLNRLGNPPYAVPVLWSCLACPTGGNFIDDDLGRGDHRARFGHEPRPGRPLCPIAAVGT
jgi:hypothetical protein